MFKDVFILKKSSYHAKMMNYIWGFRPESFTHMCLYWWLSVLNHIIIIPFILYKGIRFILSIIIKYTFSPLLISVDDYMTALDRRQSIEFIEKALVNPEILKKYQNKWYRVASRIDTYVSYNNMTYREENIIYDTLMKEYKKINLEEYNKKEARRKKTQELTPMCTPEKAKIKLTEKQEIVKLVKFIKPIMKWVSYVLGSLLVITILYYLGVGFYYIATHMHKLTFPKNFWRNLGIIFGTAVAIVGIMIIIIVFAEKFGNSLKNIIIKIATFIFYPIKWVFLKLKNILCFIVQMIKDECPAIEWKD